MRGPETRTAAPDASRMGGGDIEGTGSIFRSETYRSPVAWTIPAPEDPSRLARVIPHAGRLFAVQTFREPRP